MLTSINIQDWKFYAGASAGLNEPTATVTLQLDGVPDDSAACARRWHGGATTLRPGEPLSQVGPGDWPDAFLADAGGSSFARWVVALTVAFQRWAREPAGQGRVLACTAHSITLALPVGREGVLRAALPLALQHLLIWSRPEGNALPDWLSAQFEQWLNSLQQGGLSPNNQRFALAARTRRIPCVPQYGLLELGWGSAARRMDSTFSTDTGVLAAGLARDKFRTSGLLSHGGVPVPRAARVANWEAALQVAGQFGWPVVIKPSNLDQGVGVVPDIRDAGLLRSAYEAAERHSPGAVMIERHVEGRDFRLMVVRGKLLCATRRDPGAVTGDGRGTVAALVDQVNADPRRGSGKRSMLIALSLDAEALLCLSEQGLAADSVPAAGRLVRLRRTANISTGGTAVDVTAVVHPDNAALAIRAARLIGLDIAGIDLLCPDITQSWRKVGGAICEVNAQPGMRVHWLGEPQRDLNGEVLDLLHDGATLRIPTAAITGTNGKSSTARMLHHIWLGAGRRAGVCTTAGVWIGDEQVSADNLSGYPGARMMFSDPGVEAAVIEMPRKGLLRFGHPCDRYDVAALLNIQDDHIGVDGIASLDAMAELKAEVLARAGTVVLNADDARCLAMAARAGAARVLLVGRSAASPAMQAHLAGGGAAVFVQTHQGQPWLVLAEGAAQTPLLALGAIPATMHGLLPHNESNAMFAAALAWAQGLPLPVIATALASFSNSPEHNPGRYNFIDGWPFQVLLDYGHNPDGVAAVSELALALPVAGQRRLLSQQVGNRHRAHLDACAASLARGFDQFLLTCDPDFVGASADYAGDDPAAAMQGAYTAALERAGVAPQAISRWPDLGAALAAALAQCQPGDLLVVLAEPALALPVLQAGASS